MGAIRCSRATPTRSTSSSSVPNTLIPIGVRTPVVSMSMRVLIGIVQAFVQPGNCIFPFISVVSSSQVSGRSSGQNGRKAGFSHPGDQPEYQRSWCFLRHSLGGRSCTVVSTMVMGAGSVALSARPTLPNTVATSGKLRSMRSWYCSCRFASSMEMFGNVMGM